MSNPTEIDQYLDLRNLSAYCSLGVPTLRDYLRSGGLPHFKLKGKILVKKSEFDRWLESFRIKTDQEFNGIIDSVLESLTQGESEN
jgi:excisionase family DNA binding protein